MTAYDWSPQPCEYCWIQTGVMQECDDSCAALTPKKYNQYNGHFRTPGGKPLIRKGKKP